MEGYIECETPNKGISKFTGKMCYKSLSGALNIEGSQKFAQVSPTLEQKFETDVTPYNRSGLEVGVVARSCCLLSVFLCGCLCRVSLVIIAIALPLPFPWS